MDEAAIETTKLGKAYPGGVRALDEVSIRTAYGEIYAYLGRNGSGMTTTIRILTTLTTATTGTARVAGHDVRQHPGAARRAIGVTMQQAALDETMTGQELLQWLAALWGLPAGVARARVGEVVDRFGLGPVLGRQIATYSGGTRRRLDLAAALLHQPKVLFLDEPTTGPSSRPGAWSPRTPPAGLRRRNGGLRLRLHVDDSGPAATWPPGRAHPGGRLPCAHRLPAPHRPSGGLGRRPHLEEPPCTRSPS
jgi:energy-coupling factor transporter ATP-binding protein EcfA2